MKNFFWAFPLLIFFIAGGVLLPVSPIYRPIPSVDPSVYLYVGRQILEGGVPYRDAWDHKQPLLYLIYAFGLWITPGSLWGIWSLLWLSIGSGAWMIYGLLLRGFGRFMAFLSVTAGLLALYPVLWGGAIEEFSIPFQAAAVLLLAFILSTRTSQLRLAYSAGLGMCIALSFFLKQNMVAAGGTALVYLFGYLLVTRRWREWAVFAAAAGGFCLVALPLVTYLGLAGALYRYWDAAFVFNSRYAGLGLLERFSATLDALEFISSMPGLLVAFAAWIACAGIVFLQVSPGLARVIRLRFAKWAGLGLGLGSIVLSLAVELVGGEPGFGLLQKALIGGGVGFAGISLMLFSPRLRDSILSWLEQLPVGMPMSEDTRSPAINFPLFAFLYFPTILALLTLSGRNYVYYFIPFIPFLMITFGATAGVLLGAADGASRKVVWAIVLAAWLSMAYLPLLQLGSAYAGQRFQPLPEIISYISETTRPEETIMVWGKPSTYVYILSHRNAPTRYFYQAPVFQADYNADLGVSAQILDDMQENPPRLFLFTYETTDPVPIDRCPLPAADDPNSPGGIFRFICNNYLFEGHVSEFLVFRLP